MVACFFVYRTCQYPPSFLLSLGAEETPEVVIHDNWRHGTPDPVNLTDIPIDKIRPENTVVY